jgi:hypothetical protein
MKVILVCGVIGSGKDYFVKKYRKDHPEEVVEEKKFAWPIRQFTGNLVGVNLMNETTYESWKADPKNRQLLVDVGQYMKEATTEDIWAVGVLNQLTEDKTYIISDFRFPIEYRTICSKHKATIRFCNYKSARYTINPNQISEKLACFLVSKGIPDNQDFTCSDFYKLIKEFEGE